MITLALQPCRNRLRENRARGFTLLEVLVATLLSATLLAVLWGLFGIFRQLFVTGHARVSQSQLVRSLMQQLCDDLCSTIEDSPAAGPADDWFALVGQQTSVRRFGLLGTRHSLQIDVLQVIPLEESPALNADVTRGGRGASAQQVPELRTVFYTFVERGAAEDVPPNELLLDQPDLRPGLTRLQLDFETPYEDARGFPSGGRFSMAADFGVDRSGYDISADSSSGDPQEALLEDDSVAWVPEVVQLEFRYFDGNVWSGQWDSLKRKSLPVAVEVTMKVRSPDEPEGGPPNARLVAQGETAGGEQVEDDPEALRRAARASEIARLPTYRLVIDLPSSRQHGAVQRAKVAQRARSLRVPAPLSVPRLGVGKTPRGGAAVPPPRPDQWIRVEP